MHLLNMSMSINQDWILLRLGIDFDVTSSFLNFWTVTAEEQQFRDKFIFYRFHDDVDSGKEPLRKPPSDAARDAQNRKEEVISQLIQQAPDAVLKAILRKP